MANPSLPDRWAKTAAGVPRVGGLLARIAARAYSLGGSTVVAVIVYISGRRAWIPPIPWPWCVAAVAFVAVSLVCFDLHRELEVVTAERDTLKAAGSPDSLATLRAEASKLGQEIAKRHPGMNDVLSDWETRIKAVLRTQSAPVLERFAAVHQGRELGNDWMETDRNNENPPLLRIWLLRNVYGLDGAIAELSADHSTVAADRQHRTLRLYIVGLALGYVIQQYGVEQWYGGGWVNDLIDWAVEVYALYPDLEADLPAKWYDDPNAIVPDEQSRVDGLYDRAMAVLTAHWIPL